MTAADDLAAEPTPPQAETDAEDSRDAWLDLALLDGGASALATAARGGRPLPKKTE